jgi:hypothetical protein
MYALVYSLPVHTEAILPINPRDRFLGLICLMMFIAGICLACHEVVKWWKKRIERFESPPLPGLISYELDSNRRWRPTMVMGVRLSQTRAIPWLVTSAEALPPDPSVQENRAV